MNLHARQGACPIQPQVSPDKFGNETLISLMCINVQNISVFPAGMAQCVLIHPLWIDEGLPVSYGSDSPRTSVKFSRTM